MSIELAVFPTLVVVVENCLTEHQRQQMVSHILSIKGEASKHHTILGDAVSTHSTKKKNILPELAELEGCKYVPGMIYNHVMAYAQKTSFAINDVKIEKSWINIQKEGSVLAQHKHGGSTISGALYLNVDNDSSSLCFDNPNPFSSFTSKTGNISSYSTDFIKHKPQNGTLVLFPSWLSHGSKNEQNRTKNRIVLSFNVV
jgi:uncharacterized protein (TIGR02466 family)